MWVAAAYDKEFYVGKVVKITSTKAGHEVWVNFLTRGQGNLFHFPARKDIANLDPVYIFSINVVVEKLGGKFSLANFKEVEDLYNKYYSQFMQKVTN